MEFDRLNNQRKAGPVKTTSTDRPLKIAATGFVEAGAGSVASANAILLRELPRMGHHITFFSKPSFVDPRPLFPPDNPLHERFSFVESTNRITDRIRAHLEKIPVLGLALRRLDTFMYHRAIVRCISGAHQSTGFDVVLWLGEYAAGRVPGLPSVSFVQGPPGTDARSILSRWGEIRKLTPPLAAWRWRLLAKLRLSRPGLPPFHHSDLILVGSRQSERTLCERYHIPQNRLGSIPYPIDLDHFQLQPVARPRELPAVLRILWLGRIIPRKRLDLFLDGAALAIQQGLALRLTIVGNAPMFPGYLRLIKEFPFPNALEYHERMERAEIPALFGRHDVLVQPSEEEDFGSSVAEAQACGLPVIVGMSNGNAGYLSGGDIHLRDDHPQTLAAALKTFAGRSETEMETARMESRCFAEKTYSPQSVAMRLDSFIQRAAGSANPSTSSE